MRYPQALSRLELTIYMEATNMEKIIHNVLTDEIEVKDLTGAEIKQMEADAKAAADKAKEKAEVQQAILDAKKPILEKLGITEDEAKLLLA